MKRQNRVWILNARSGERGTLAFIVVTYAALLAAGAAQGATTVFVNRAAFESTLSNIVVDDYERLAYRNADIINSPGNVHIHSDASMNAVFGETTYTTTGFTNWNIIAVDSDGINHLYCAGCNGSYLLDFTGTSAGTAGGVFGVGLDVVGSADVFGTHAFVTYGDGGTQDIPVPEDGFWGITSGLRIKTVHFGLAGGGINSSNDIQRMAMDNLTIGAAIPEPASVTLAGIVAALAAAAVRRRRLAP